MIRLGKDFYRKDVLEIAPLLPGCYLCLNREGKNEKHMINEIEAYRGEEDLACHARFGRTKRNAVMYEEGGLIYMYFIYGMYWMMNIVTGEKDLPQAILIRGVSGLNGPGKMTKSLKIDGSFYGESLIESGRIWIENHGIKPAIITTARIGIKYAGPEWSVKPWRFVVQEKNLHL